MDQNLLNDIECDPDLSNNFTDDNTPEIVIPAHSRILIPSGIRTHFDKGYALVFFNKSGVCTKKGLDVGACVIDSDYRGEIHFSLINTTNKEVRLNFGDKIVQGLMLPYPDLNFEYIDGYDYDALIESETENTRKAGGFGSTGNK